jgi:hypothetical protein
MALVPATLATELTTAFLAGMAPGTTRAQQAQRIANAYNTYALVAQSCAGLPPSFVNLPTLTSLLQIAMTGHYLEPATPARMWGDAFQAFWTGALFGVTGTVTVIPGTAALKASLTSIFSSRTYTPLPTTVNRIATTLDTFTKLVVVQDTAIPPPSGCTAPII